MEGRSAPIGIKLLALLMGSQGLAKLISTAKSSAMQQIYEFVGIGTVRSGTTNIYLAIILSIIFIIGAFLTIFSHPQSWIFLLFWAASRMYPSIDMLLKGGPLFYGYVFSIAIWGIVIGYILLNKYSERI